MFYLVHIHEVRVPGTDVTRFLPNDHAKVTTHASIIINRANRVFAKNVLVSSKRTR